MHSLIDGVFGLGHVIDADRLHTTDENVSAIKEVPRPQNITELKVVLINY